MSYQPIKKLILIFSLTSAIHVYADVDHALAEYKKGNYPEALREFKVLAEQGDAKAQLHLGRMYDLGNGVAKDIDQAINWYLKAANQGQRAAQFNIGNMYERGDGLPKDPNQAHSWYLKSASQGYSEAQIGMGRLYLKGEGVPLDYKKSAEWITKAAEQGDSKAQMLLGGMYSLGKGVIVDPKKSAEWMLKAANQGLPEAQYILGTIYSAGTGVPKDPQKANEWFAKAAKQGFPSLNSPATTSTQQSNQVINPEAKKFTELTEKTKILWAELNSFRYDKSFHQYGYWQGKKPGGAWVIRQKALSDECSNYRDALSPQSKSQYNLCSVIQFIWVVGMDWYDNHGNNKKDTATMVSQIEKSLKNNGKNSL